MRAINKWSGLLLLNFVLSPNLIAGDGVPWEYSVYLNGIKKDAKKGDLGPLIRHQQLIDKTVAFNIANGTPIKLFYEYQSPEVMVPYTEYPVDTAYPECGNGNDVGVYGPLKADDLKKLFAFGELVELGAGTGGLATAAVAAIIHKINEANTKQSKASCSVTCALIPAAIDNNSVSVESEVKAHHLEEYLSRSFPSGWNGYWHLEAPVFSDEIVKVAIPENDYLRNRTDSQACEMRMVCQRLRNWSDGHSIWLRIRAKFDASLIAQKSCTDMTLISREYLRSVMPTMMHREDAKRYIDAYVKDYVLGSPPN